MPRFAITAAVTATRSASRPWKPCTQPLAGSSSGGCEEDLHRPEDEQEEREADPLPLPRPRPERRQEDEQLGGVDDREAEEAVRVERALARTGDVRGDEVRLEEHADDDQARQHEVDPQECSFHAREPTGPAG